MSNFDAKKIKDDIVQWISDWFEINGKDCRAVVGISGGIDSSVVAALCCEALGKDRVYGVLLPRHRQNDIDDALELCKHLGIEYCHINIGKEVDNLLYRIYLLGELDISEQTKINFPARIRMSMLYAISQSINGRVANTSNLSESYVGFDTRYGDSVGDFSPLFNLTKTEIRLMARELELPNELINKTPQDGLCGMSDEQKFGFTYEALDRYIRTGEIDDLETKKKIDAMHNKNLFKLQPMPTFNFEVN